MKHFVLLLSLFAMMAGQSAWADHRHRARIGVYFGFPYAWHVVPPFYSPYPYYSPRVIVLPPPAPTVYVEQPPAVTTSPRLPAGFWYYCYPAQAYYPDVQECPAPWQAVAPQPQTTNE